MILALPSEQLFLIGLAFIALIIGSYTDWKTREVPDWLSMGLIVLGLGTRLIFTISTGSGWYLLEGLLGFILFFVLAWVMFYSGQWGGGDSKLLMGLGAVFGLDVGLPGDLQQMSIAFVMNVLIVGAVYGLCWAIILAIKNRKAFVQQLKDISKERKIRFLRKLVQYSFFIFVFIFIVTASSTTFLVPQREWRLAVSALFVMMILLYWVLLLTKAVEKIAMLKHIAPERLTPGDWIAEDVIVKGKRICGPKDLGIDEQQIKTLLKLKQKKLIHTVLIKEGIPFVPSFLLAFIVTLLAQNLVVTLLI
ncbi:TPA: prepilin peptidase [Candidatus Woesearchaeota archaeon]|nr:prepilin peptidase [Candidatus Woesearchaeota archaeon]